MNNKALIIFIIISLITVLSVVFISTKEAASKEITSLTITQFKERLEDEENILIDIRTSQELENTGIISWAEWLDFYSPDFKKNLSKRDKSKHYLIYCNSWNRSKSALQIMSDLWFENASDLSWWITLWKNAWFEVINAK